MELAALRRYCGDVSQLVSANSSSLTDGTAAGVRTIEVRTVGGLSSTIFVDRALDIGPTWVGSKPLGWVSPTGAVHPAYATNETWLRSFAGGLLTTTGLLNVGPPSRYGDEEYGQHGRVSNLPARNVHTKIVDTDAGPRLTISGQVRESSVYGPDLELSRQLVFHVGAPVLEIHDRVTNLGWRPTPLMILYHFNIGFPVVAPGARIVVDSRGCSAVGATPVNATEKWAIIDEPVAGASAEVFEHELGSDSVGTMAIVNTHEPFGPVGVEVAWQRAQLPRLFQWRMQDCGMFLTGIEPANCRGRGIEEEFSEGSVDMLAPGASREFDLVVTATDTVEGAHRLLLGSAGRHAT
jgi:Domain of unknown function (DUF4432)